MMLDSSIPYKVFSDLWQFAYTGGVVSDSYISSCRGIASDLVKEFILTAIAFDILSVVEYLLLAVSLSNVVQFLLVSHTLLSRLKGISSSSDSIPSTLECTISHKMTDVNTKDSIDAFLRP